MPTLLDKLLLDLNQTKLATTNNPLYGFLKKLLGEIPVASAVSYNLVAMNIDTRDNAVNIPILTVLKPNIFYVIKDVFGNASANNITLTGTVDGVVDPTISTDYGVLRVYNTINGFMTW